MFAHGVLRPRNRSKTIFRKKPWYGRPNKKPGGTALGEAFIKSDLLYENRCGSVNGLREILDGLVLGDDVVTSRSLVGSKSPVKSSEFQAHEWQTVNQVAMSASAVVCQWHVGNKKCQDQAEPVADPPTMFGWRAH